MKNILKALLRKNELTSDPNDMTAIVSSMGKINRSGLIDALMEEGIELKRETLEDVVTRYNRMAARFAARGWNVDTGLVYLRAIITGVFFGKKFDPVKNGVYVSATQGMEIRKELSNTEVEILGEMPDVIHIYQVINLQTKAADGTLIRSRNAEVEGSYIKVTGSDPTVGVYLESADDSQLSYKLDADLIVVNNPSKLLLLIPAEWQPGAYRLKVITQFTGAGKQLKAPRQAVFDQELTVI
ncbi:MAG: DUF4469 domain-containing protein [Tannerella sp.]|jgi:hypothetical protein|nr:DUF4469 domain-containing protein [Tannerella sp.]